MKLSKYTVASASTILLLSLLTPSALAVGPQDSKATITFTLPSDAPAVLDPENPESTLDSTNPLNPSDSATGESGPLTLDYVSSIDFGNQPLALKETKYLSKTMRPFIQVTDRRGSGGLGWHVTATATPFSNSDNSPGLKGAEITFANGEVVSPDSANFNSPLTTGSLNLPADGTTVAAVVTATEGQGLGSWLVKWMGTSQEANEKVTLNIPAGESSEGNFKSTITWTLSDAPTN